MKQLTAILIVVLIKTIYGSNVLFISDVPSPSHQIWNYEISAALVAKGYNVTVFGAQPLKGHGQKNYHIIDVQEMTEDIHSAINVNDLIEMSNYENILVFYEWSYFICNYTLNSDGLQILLNYPRDFFQLIIIDPTCISCLSPLVQHFKYPPTVAVTAFLLPPYLSEKFGNDIQPSYLPFYMVEHDGKSTFFQRLVHHFWYRFDSFVREYHVEKKLEKAAKEKFGPNMDSFKTIDNHVSLLLCNLIQGYHYSQPLTPNIIPVGGLHINTVKKLPEEFQKILDNSKHGVILFSLGTNVQSASLSEEKRNVILNAFGQLKQTVLWKFEKELDNLPKNVIIKKWMPQREILAHSNTKLFISHGGGLSTIEASILGVPVLGIPFFGDQMMNVQVMVDKKLALAENYLELTSATFLNKINELLHNPMYLENAKGMSKIIKDQPETPMDRALFWLEYAIRHNGTHFLDPESRHLSLLVTSSMDVYLFSLFLVIIIGFLLKKSICFLKYNFFNYNGGAKKLKKN